MTELDAEQIQGLIPHRPPFLLIDRVVEIESGRRIVGVKQVSLDNDLFLRGHFPDYPVMPGVLIVEALAQAGAVLVMQDGTNAGKIPYFARIDNCRFRQQVRPGDTLRLEVEVTSFRDPVGKAHARALVDGKLACEADLTFALGNAQSSE
ncbi:MAG TPA: 3-hydroxyacyl-ACP dehydratase FabZ [Chloroflexota bacterium]